MTDDHDHTIVSTRLNGKWDLRLPRARAERAEWHTEAGWERKRLDRIHDMIEPGQTVFEVGSECGDFGALFASWGANVVLVEGNWKSWAMQRTIFEANGYTPLATFDGFAGARPHRERRVETEGRFALGGWPAAADNGENRPYDFRTLHSGYPQIPVLTIDLLRQMVGCTVDHITMDIEGAEVDAMFGAVDTLTEDRPICHLSVHPDFMEPYGHTAEDLHQFMRDHGYVGELLETSHEQHWCYVPR